MKFANFGFLMLIFFDKKYKVRSTTFINDNFCLLSFLKHFITKIGPQFQNLISNRALIQQNPFKIRKCYLPFKQAMVWCGNCWKVLKWYLLNNNINIFCILELWQLNTWTWRCFGSLWLYVFNGCFFLCLSGNTETSWDYVIVNINQVPKIHCCQIKSVYWLSDYGLFLNISKIVVLF